MDAIKDNKGGMSSLSPLTDAQVKYIAEALSSCNKDEDDGEHDGEHDDEDDEEDEEDDDEYDAPKRDHSSEKRVFHKKGRSHK